MMNIQADVLADLQKTKDDADALAAKKAKYDAYAKKVRDGAAEGIFACAQTAMAATKEETNVLCDPTTGKELDTITSIKKGPDADASSKYVRCEIAKLAGAEDPPLTSAAAKNKMDWRVTIAAQLNADPTIQAIFGGKKDPITASMVADQLKADFKNFKDMKTQFSSGAGKNSDDDEDAESASDTLTNYYLSHLIPVRIFVCFVLASYSPPHFVATLDLNLI